MRPIFTFAQNKSVDEFVEQSESADSCNTPKTLITRTAVPVQVEKMSPIFVRIYMLQTSLL